MFLLESLDIKYIRILSIISIVSLFVLYYYNKNKIILWMIVLFFLVFIQNIVLYNVCETESFVTPLWDAWDNRYTDVDKKTFAIEKIIRKIDTNTKPLQYYSKTNIVNMNI